MAQTDECKMAESLALKLQGKLMSRLNLTGYKGTSFELFTFDMSDDANTMTMTVRVELGAIKNSARI